MHLTRRALIFTFLCLFIRAVSLDASELNLSAIERKWLNDHPVIRIAPDPSAAPIEWFNDEDVYEGIAADYVKLVESRLGIRFEIVRADSWQSVLELMRTNGADVLPAAMVSPQRQKFLRFTRPHINVSGVVISSKEYEKLEQLPDKKVAVVEGHIWDDLVQNHEVDVNIVLVEDVKTGIELTALGAVEAMVGDIATATHVIQDEGLTNLRLISSLEQDLELSFAVRADWPELATIIEKAVATIAQHEHQLILEKWLHLKLPQWWQNSQLQMVLLGFIGSGLVVIITFIAWNRTLRHQVLMRTKELKDAQDGLVRAAKLESVGQLAAGVAHEVKNPLGIIQMGIDYLRGDPQIKDDIAKELLKDMGEAVQRADRVIRGLLDFSHDSKVKKELTNINLILEKSIHLVEHELRKKRIEVVTDFDQKLPELNVDDNRLQQVFVNSFMNSLHAMEPGGCLSLETLETELVAADVNSGCRSNLRVGHRCVAIEIADTGHGIESQHLNKVADPFFTTKPVGEGTGLGLSICRNIVEMHNGIFTIANLPERGVIVRVLLPQPGK